MKKAIIALFVCTIFIGCASPGSRREGHSDSEMSTAEQAILQERLDKLENNQREILLNMKELLRMLSRIYKEKY
ncbi:MAG: hypothetical protein GF375_07520 [Candidatus Omnitrophica bacterium]|nr:hypothetical protein [Candidatus Omnitrophota bacterium]MBD3269819.1 hypothetical protein [Candidatus Omnitrophota bacterium]